MSCAIAAVLPGRITAPLSVLPTTPASQAASSSALLLNARVCSFQYAHTSPPLCAFLYTICPLSTSLTAPRHGMPSPSPNLSHLHPLLRLFLLLFPFVDLREHEGVEQHGAGRAPCRTGLLCAQLSLTRSTDLGPGMTKRLGVGFPSAWEGGVCVFSVFLSSFVLPPSVKGYKADFILCCYIANSVPESTRETSKATMFFSGSQFSLCTTLKMVRVRRVGKSIVAFGSL